MGTRRLIGGARAVFKVGFLAAAALVAGTAARGQGYDAHAVASRGWVHDHGVHGRREEVRIAPRYEGDEEVLQFG